MQARGVRKLHASSTCKPTKCRLLLAMARSLQCRERDQKLDRLAATSEGRSPGMPGEGHLSMYALHVERPLCGLQAMQRYATPVLKKHTHAHRHTLQTLTHTHKHASNIKSQARQNLGVAVDSWASARPQHPVDAFVDGVSSVPGTGTAGWHRDCTATAWVQHRDGTGTAPRRTAQSAPYATRRQ